MEKKPLTTKEAAEYLGITSKTLKEWDYNDILKPSYYTDGGHRRYSLEVLDKYIKKSENKVALNDEIGSLIMDYMSMYAKGVCELTSILENQEIRDNFTDFPTVWKKSSILLLQLTMEYGLNDFTFPLTIDEQYILWKTPLYKWPIRYFNELFQKVIDEEPVLFNYFITDYCEELASKYDDDPNISIFKEIIDETRFNKEDKEYKDIRKFIVENPIITITELDRHLFVTFSGNARKYRDRIERLYEEIPNEYALDNGYFYSCPYCGWTLKKNKKTAGSFKSDKPFQYRCNTDKCITHAKKWEIKESLLAKQYLRVKPSIQKYVVEPGIVELELYQKLLKAFDEKYKEHSIDKVTLYPNCDFADIKLEFSDGEVWMVDVKDWKLAQALANDLNKEGMFKSRERVDFNRGFLVVPTTYGNDYINQLKARWNESDRYEVLTDRQFVQLVNKELEVR